MSSTEYSSSGESSEEETLEIEEIENDIPNIGLQVDFFHYEFVSSETERFEGRFVINSPPITHEINLLSKIQNCMEGCKEVSSILYSYRSIDDALPRMLFNTVDDPHFNVKVYRILKPQVRKMEKVMRFLWNFAALFRHILSELENFERRFRTTFSDRLLDSVVKFLDKIYVIHRLILYKRGTMKSDFSRYKRSVRWMDKEEFDEDEMEEIENFCTAPVQPVSVFLLDSHLVVNQMSSGMTKVDRSLKSMITIVKYCLGMFRDEMFLCSEEKHRLLRVIVFGLLLCEKTKSRIKSEIRSREKRMQEQAHQGEYSIEDEKKISALCATLGDMETELENFDAREYSNLWRRYPYLPMFCDLTVSIDRDLDKCTFVDPKLWKLSRHSEKSLERKFLLTTHVEEIRKEFVDISTKVQIMCNKVRKMSEVHVDHKKIILDLSIRALRTISKWETMIREQSTWKYNHSAKLSDLEKIDELRHRYDIEREDPENQNLTIDCYVTSLERRVRYNHSKDERIVLVDVISMLKGLSSLMIKNSELLGPIARDQIHREVQEFVDNNMLIRSTDKYENPQVYERFVMIRSQIELVLGMDINDDNEEEEEGEEEETRNLISNVTSSRLALLLHILSSFITKRTENYEERQLKKNKKRSTTSASLKTFQKRLFYFTKLLSRDFSSIISHLSDLSYLWFREIQIYLGYERHVPIDTSLPWILVKSIIITKGNLHLTDSLLYALSIYNDAASFSLYHLKSRCLYDEVEAEVNLVFDQLVHKVSEHIYTYFKIRASTVVLGNHKKNSTTKNNIPPNRFLDLLRQRNFTLLGRRIDLNRIFTKSINSLVKKNVDHCIRSFTTKPLTRILEYESLLETIIYTHQYLSEILDLDPFVSILAVCDERTSLADRSGKIMEHVFNELIDDVFPNFIYNAVTQRYVRSPVTILLCQDDENDRKKLYRVPSGYNSYGSKGLVQDFRRVHRVFDGFFGTEHLQILVRVLGMENISVLVENIISWMKSVMMMSDPPPPDLSKMKLDGSYHTFRVLGNAVTFLLLLDHNLSLFNFRKLLISRFRTNNIEGDSSRSVFTFALSQLQTHLHKIIISKKKGSDWGFKKRWVKLQFSFHQDVEENKNLDVFGHGFDWAGNLIVYLLGGKGVGLEGFSSEYEEIIMSGKKEDSRRRDWFRRIEFLNNYVFDILRRYLPLRLQMKKK